MSFLLTCPNCGDRSVDEYRFGGEVTARPAPDAPRDHWDSYFYFRSNRAAVQQEWWNHRYGCRLWFYARRDTATNQVQETFRPG